LWEYEWGLLDVSYVLYNEYRIRCNKGSNGCGREYGHGNIGSGWERRAKYLCNTPDTVLH